MYLVHRRWKRNEKKRDREDMWPKKYSAEMNSMIYGIQDSRLCKLRHLGWTIVYSVQS